MPLPKHIDFVSLEVYGTLIDWETGIYEAFRKEAERDGFTIERDRLIPLFLETQAEIMAGSYELYAEVLRRTALAGGGGAGVGAGARAVELPAEQHPVVGRRSGTRMRCSSACGRSTTRIRLRTR